MTGLDWLMIGVVMLSALVAAAQGFMYEVFSLAGVVAGYLLAAWGYWQVAPFYARYVKAAWAADLFGFLTVFLVVVVVAGSVGRIARFGMKEAGLRWFDRLLGGMFGVVRGILLVVIFVLALATFSPGSRLLARSRAAPYLLVLARAAVWAAPSQVRQQFRAGAEAIVRMREGGPAATRAPAVPSAPGAPRE